MNSGVAEEHMLFTLPLPLKEDLSMSAVSGNPFTATFEDLSKLRIEGVWNAAQNRIEF